MDETIYLCTDKGALALSAFPELKIRWKYDNGFNEITGPVSLSQDERWAYFISVNTDQHYSRLMMLDNLDGTRVDSSGYILGGYQNDNNYLIPAPVVGKKNDVFVLNGYDNSNKLLVFRFNEKTNKLRVADSIKSLLEINTGISQPVIDAESNVFFVYKNKIARYDTSRNDRVNVLASSNELNNASILIVDANSCIYALDPYNGNTILGFRYDGRQLKNMFIAKFGPDGNFKKNLVRSPSGLLYTVNNNEVKSMHAKDVEQDHITLTEESLNSNMLYIAEKTITVNGFKVAPSVNAIIQSFGTILLKPGFHVARGAQLSFKTRY
jgi:hypothetical protein